MEWFSESRIERRHLMSFTDVLYYESKERNFENFDLYAGIEVLIPQAVEAAVREIFGARFRGFEDWGRPETMVVMGRTAPRHCVDIKSSLYIRYAGFTDFLADIDTRLRVMQELQAAIARRLVAHYPVGVTLTLYRQTRTKINEHQVCYPLSIRLESRMPMKEVA